MTVQSFIKSALFGVSAVAVGVLGTGVTAAQDAQSFFKDKTMRIVVGYGPGGGYDAYARMLAPHIGRVIGATVIVENQPGAGGLTALNRLYTASGDATQMMIVNGTAAALSQILEQDAVKYDLANFGYLGIVSSSPWIWLVTPESPIKTPADAMKPGVKVSWAASGVADGLGDGAAITCATLELDCQIVRGYPGSSAAALAVTQGEMDALYVSDTSANNYVQAGGARAVANMGRERSRFFKDVPTIFDLVALNEEQQWWFDFRSTVDNLGRILVTPADLPEDRLAFLQEAVRKVLTDEAVMAEGEKAQRYIEFQDAKKTRDMVVQVVGSITPEQRSQAQDIILKRY